VLAWVGSEVLNPGVIFHFILLLPPDQQGTRELDSN
jgi:hypothetical protein